MTAQSLSLPLSLYWAANTNCLLVLVILASSGNRFVLKEFGSTLRISAVVGRTSESVKRPSSSAIVRESLYPKEQCICITKQTRQTKHKRPEWNEVCSNDDNDGGGSGDDDEKTALNYSALKETETGQLKQKAPSPVNTTSAQPLIHSFTFCLNFQIPSRILVVHFLANRKLVLTDWYSLALVIGLPHCVCRD